MTVCITVKRLFAGDLQQYQLLVSIYPILQVVHGFNKQARI